MPHKEGMSHGGLNNKDYGKVVSVFIFAFPHLGLGFSFSTYRFLIRGVMRKHRKRLALS